VEIRRAKLFPRRRVLQLKPEPIGNAASMAWRTRRVGFIRQFDGALVEPLATGRFDNLWRASFA